SDNDKQSANKDGKAEQKDSSGDKTQRPDEKLPTWQPEGAHLTQLGKEVSVEGYRVRPPIGYQAGELPGKPGMKLIGWGPQPRTDGTRPEFTFGIITPPPDQPKLSLDKFMDVMLEG